MLAQATANPAVLSDPAIGYCSHACAQGSTSGCTPQYQDLQNDPTQVMSCRPLVLDDDTIAEICKDPVKCQEYFNNSRSAFFCARGGDGGTEKLQRPAPLRGRPPGAGAEPDRAAPQGCPARFLSAPSSSTVEPARTPLREVQPPGTSST